MFHPQICDLRLQQLSDELELPAVPTPRSVAECEEWTQHLTQLVDEKGRLKRGLTQEELAFIQSERIITKTSFVYWAERYAYINRSGSTLGKMYPLWESQQLILDRLAKRELEIHDSKEGSSDGILANCLKARQLGASTLAQSINAHRASTQTHIFGLVAADVPEQSAFLFDMFERIVENLPWFLRPDIVDHVKNSELSFDTDSHIWVGSGKSTRGTEGKRGQLGRGKTLSLAHLSELSTWDDPEQIDDALLPAIPIHPRTFVFAESTAKGRNNWWHKHWLSSKASSGRFIPIFIPWYAHRTKYSLPVPPGWSPSETSLAHAYRCEETSPRWMGRRVTLSKGQLYWYETTRAYYEERDRLPAFLEEYAADDDECFQFAGTSVVPVMVQQRIKDQARGLVGALEIRPHRELR